MNDYPEISLKRAQNQIPNLTKSYFYKIKKQWKREESYQPEESKNFRKLILRAIIENPSGLTVTFITKKINAARNTVSKYIGILEAENKIIAQKIGAYTLYFPANKKSIDLDLIQPYYVGMLSGLMNEFNETEKYKELGRSISEYMKFPYVSLLPNEANPLKDGDIPDFLEFFGKSFTYVDFMYRKRPLVEIEIEKEGNKGRFTLKDIELFDISQKFEVHYYIVAGITEKIVARALKTEAICNIEQIDVKNRTVKITLEIKKTSNMSRIK
ncbi:MAG: hypothetical protein GY870_14520 [archaeon]|nr:hypothetical protein [archaeon]